MAQTCVAPPVKKGKIMKKLMCAMVFATSCAAFGAGAVEANAISFEGYTSSTALQLVNGVNEYDEDGTQKSAR